MTKKYTDAFIEVKCKKYYFEYLDKSNKSDKYIRNAIITGGIGIVCFFVGTPLIIILAGSTILTLIFFLAVIILFPWFIVRLLKKEKQLGISDKGKVVLKLCFIANRINEVVKSPIRSYNLIQRVPPVFDWWEK